jgi:Rhomboid family
VAASLIVAFMYGSLAWGMLPINPRYSWETHLAAAVIGVVMALLYRQRDNPPRARYTWEDEPAEIDGEFAVEPDFDPRPRIETHTRP